MISVANCRYVVRSLFTIQVNNASRFNVDLISPQKGRQMNNPEWRGAHMRNRRGASVTPASTEQVLPFSNSLRSAARRDGETVLALVHQAADVVRGIEIRANKTANYAENIAQRAVERLQSAETRIGELEAERRANQAYISEAHGKIEEAAKALKLER